MRHFVEITAKDREALHRLHEHDLDLVRHTASPHPHESDHFVVDGLLTMTEVEKLRAAGYRVHVVEPAAHRGRAHTEPGYLTADGLDAAVEHLCETYPS